MHLFALAIGKAAMGLRGDVCFASKRMMGLYSVGSFPAKQRWVCVAFRGGGISLRQICCSQRHPFVQLLKVLEPHLGYFDVIPELR
jgi:hypothetical protein